jgi:AcrR family transcriptional regulator
MSDAAVRRPGRPVDEALQERRREEILEAAVRLFAERGYPGTDMQVLADTLGVGKGTVYRYFPSKRDLFLAAADYGMRRLQGNVDAAIAGAEDPLERVVIGIRTYLTFFADHPEFVELLIQERAHFKDRKKPTFFEHREARVERWRALYRGLIAAGRVRGVPAERITDVVSDLLYGTMFTNYFSGPRKPPEEQARDIIDIVFHGILTEPERGRWQ